MINNVQMSSYQNKNNLAFCSNTKLASRFIERAVKFINEGNLNQGISTTHRVVRTVIGESLAFTPLLLSPDVSGGKLLSFILVLCAKGMKDNIGALVESFDVLKPHSELNTLIKGIPANKACALGYEKIKSLFRVKS